MVSERKDSYYITFRRVPDGRWRNRKVSGGERVAERVENAERAKWDRYQVGLHSPATDEAQRLLVRVGWMAAGFAACAIAFACFGGA